MGEVGEVGDDFSGIIELVWSWASGEEEGEVGLFLL